MPPSETGSAVALLFFSEVATCTVQAACLPVSHDAPLQQQHEEAGERSHCSRQPCCMHL